MQLLGLRWKQNRTRPKTRRLGVESLEGRTMLAANVLTYHNNNMSTGVNANETILTPANVNATQFGKQFVTPVDGQVYAQPLYVSNVTITTGANAGLHNVVYVATQHDSVYALDSVSGQVLWRRSFINPTAGITTVSTTDVNTDDIKPEIGITSTGVIDASTNTFYVVAKTKEVVGGKNHFVQRLHALDLGNGTEKLGGPSVIADTIYDGTSYTYTSGPFVNGSGEGAVGGRIYYNALRENQRPALTLAGGSIYIAAASHADEQPYHGWVLRFSASTLKIQGALNVTPNGEGGGIWMSGGKISVDAQGFLYVVTGDGTFDTTLNAKGFPINGNYGNTVLKIAVDTTTTPTKQNINGWGLKVADYFTPSNQDYLNQEGIDLGSTGVLILPDSAGNAAHRHLMLTSGKDGRVFLLDRDNLGKFNPNGDQTLQTEDLLLGMFGTPTFFRGVVTLADGYGGTARQFPISQGQLNPEPINETKEDFNIPAVTPSISANGTATGIIWFLVRGSNELRAYRAKNLNSLLYSSSQAPDQRDALGTVVKFTVPTVVGGMVYVGTSNSVVGYGLLNSQSLASQNVSAANVSAPASSAALPSGEIQLLAMSVQPAISTTTVIASPNTSTAVVPSATKSDRSALGKVSPVAECPSGRKTSGGSNGTDSSAGSRREALGSNATVAAAQSKRSRQLTCPLQTSPLTKR